MFEIPTFTDIQRRAIYIVLGSALALGAVFFSLAQGNASPSPVPKISLAPIVETVPTPALIIVDVAGKVLHPNIYTLPSGSRAADAITAAGGALKGVTLTDINLAHLLVDGEQIVVGAPPVVMSSAKSGTKSGKPGKSSTAIVNINTATTTQLEVLAGVGPVMAGKIVAYRNAHGKFGSIDGISKVPGFGRAKFEIIKSQLRI
jgi:competence protein ComEA